MPYKDKERRKTYNRSYGMKWYLKHREKVLENTKKMFKDIEKNGGNLSQH